MVGECFMLKMQHYASTIRRSNETMATTGTPSFARDIRPLFREHDRDEMDFVFDLWDYHDVSTNAELILDRLADGTMPCDGEWPEEHLDLFRRWIEVGTPA